MQAEAKINSEVISNENLIQQLNWRYAVKQFDSTRRVSDADWDALAETLILAASSYGLQPYKFVVVTNQEIKEKLKPHAYGQSQITDASHVVVFAAKQDLTEADVNHYFERISEVRNVPRESLAEFEATVSGFAKNLSTSGNAHNWAARQAYIALGFLLEAAALRGVDACPMEGFTPSEFDAILGLTEQGYGSVVLCPLGYRAEGDWLAAAPKVRFPKEELIQQV